MTVWSLKFINMSMNREQFLLIVDYNKQDSKKNYAANLAATSIILDINDTIFKDYGIKDAIGFKTNDSDYNNTLKKIIQAQHDLLKEVKDNL